MTPEPQLVDHLQEENDRLTARAEKAEQERDEAKAETAQWDEAFVTRVVTEHGTTIDILSKRIDEYAAIIAVEREANARLREALTPSEETKAAYICEFSVPLPEYDEQGGTVMRNINVPWITIKEIMKAILARAAFSADGGRTAETAGGEKP